MRKTVLLALVVLLVPLGLSLTGCGDTNLLSSLSTGSSEDSNIERGVEALDAGNWERAIEIFSGLSDSDAKRKYLSSAYVGRAGFDTLKLIAELDKAREAAESNGGDATYYLWSSIGAVFENSGEADGFIPSEEVEAKLLDLENALSVLFTGEIGNDWYALLPPDEGRVGPMADAVLFPNLGDTRFFQAGLYTLLKLQLNVSSLLDYGGVYLVDPVTYMILSGDLPPVVYELPEGFEVTLADDFLIIKASVDRLSGDNGSNLVDDINDFLISIGYADDYEVTIEDLNAFFESMAPPVVEEEL